MPNLNDPKKLYQTFTRNVFTQMEYSVINGPRALKTETMGQPHDITEGKHQLGS